MKRFLAILGLLALLALLVGGVAVLRARRAAACDRELERLISGPLLPGSEAVRYQWLFGIHSEQDQLFDCVVQGESVPSRAPGEAVPLGRPMLIGQDGTNKWTVVLDRTSPRFRTFMLDLLRLLADPPRDMRNEPRAKSNP